MHSFIFQLVNHMLYLILILSLPPIVAAALIGIFVSLFQALTQIQEQTLSFAIKLIVVILVIFLTSSWFSVEIYNFSISSFNLLRRL